MNADVATSCRVGKGALLDLSAWAKSCARRATELGSTRVRHFQNGRSRINPTSAVATLYQTILPTLRTTETGKPVARLALRKRKREAQVADVCMIVEGAYPYVSRGLSAWAHGVIGPQPDFQFRAVP